MMSFGMHLFVDLMVVLALAILISIPIFGPIGLVALWRDRHNPIALYARLNNSGRRYRVWRQTSNFGAICIGSVFARNALLADAEAVQQFGGGVWASPSNV